MPWWSAARSRSRSSRERTGRRALTARDSALQPRAVVSAVRCRPHVHATRSPCPAAAVDQPPSVPQELPVTSSPKPESAVNALADRFWESILALSPTTATVYGDERYNDRLPDPGPEGRAT